MGKPDLLPPPLELQFGITDHCNLRCIMCMQTAHEGIYGLEHIKSPPLHCGRRGFMEIPLFNKILSDLNRSRAPLKMVLLHWLGESLLHPQFDTIVHLLAEFTQRKPLKTGIMLFTNVILLTPDQSDFLLSDLGRYGVPLYLVYSIDAASSDTFGKIKNSQSFEQVKHNILHILNRDYGPWLHHVFRFLVMKENEDEAVEFVRFWKSIIESHGFTPDITFDVEKPYGRSIRHTINIKKVASSDPDADACRHEKIKNKIISSFNINNSPGANTRLHYNSGPLQRPPCPGPVRTPVINWDGRLTVCCPDTEMELSPGSLQEHTFDELWFGERIKEIRRLHRLGRMNELNRCARCVNLPALPIFHDELMYIQNEE